MLTVTHLAVGAALGGCVGSGGPAFALGLVSHLVLDAVPHYDIEDYRVDAGLTAAALGVLLGWGYWLTPVFWGAVGGALPDLEILLWRLHLIGESRLVFPTHSGRIGHGSRLSSRGLVPQVLLILGAVGCVVWMRS